MGQLSGRVKEGFSIFSESYKVYKKLQKHLDKQPIGYPATLSGVERRLLRDVFTLNEAELALKLDYKCQTLESIFEKVEEKGISEADLQKMLDNMEKNGAIFVKLVDGAKQYALHPFAVGIFELKLTSMTPDFYMNARKYMYQSFGLEFLSTKIPQMRVIPIQKSITPEINIATYDEVRELVLKSDGRISVAECVCRKGRDLIGRPCKETKRREVCIGFNDFHDLYTRNGFGRSITKEEAFEILAKNEKQGLVLMPFNSQEPQFVCSCCKCCCGALEMVSMLANPAEFVKSNFRAVLDKDKCTDCGLCTKKCKMEAIKMKGKKAVAIKRKRCFGCGVCVAACKPGALSLKTNSTEYTPPSDMEAMYDEIMEHKKGIIKRTLHMSKAIMW